VPESIRFLLIRGEKKKVDAIVRRMRAAPIQIEAGVDPQAARSLRGRNGYPG
jgi:hypothetical protein